MPALRTRVYIDGYNLYYGCLRKTAFKWLDVLTLFETQILPSILYRPAPDANPATMTLHPDCAIKYFTAKIIESAAKGEDSVSSQAQYHNALTTHCGGRLSFVMGNYSLYKANQHIVPADDPKRWPRDCDKIQVWKLEEKQSDVNLALHLYDDALSGDIDQVVLVTNDTDLVPALEMLQARCPHIVRGLVIPTRKVGAGGDLEREANVSLAKLAHWVRRHISDDELRTSQLPDVVPGRRRASVKPHSWYAKPHHLARMLEMARPVLRTEGEVLKWARRESAHLGGRRPIDLIETDAGAVEVFDYIEAYIRDQLDKAGDQDDLSSKS
ncbi:antitoxin Xre/MbcA/ParS toxin-binding domain-containing protein [Rhizobium sp. P44RR-XXIV]|uniref:antitoxin Xre/MbcA/ParS toxin-binding domain-containing protein n=1 Tax=Rhizobium sp. P44RR-XXIV TaxID=1921145 RepID=UPI001FED31B4|nr:antitoxin Xre/MbcA/ParS toxin-binding domain-containing protein [Rhizobium sp. P44RR-XXIV]